MVMAVVFGSISEFGFGSDDVTEWVERLEQWFVANAITDANRKRALLLSNIGARGYKLIRSLSQNQPTTKSYGDLKTLLLEHINPKPNEISQRFVFYRRDRRSGETVKDYVAELRKLSEHCNFNEKLEEHLRDKFVCGLNDGVVQQKLLATKNLTLAISIETAVAMEAAARSAKQIHGVGLDGLVHRLGEGRNPGGSKLSKFSKECFRCGSKKHLADKCPFKNQECFKCKKLGHTQMKCKKFGNPNNRMHLVEEELEVSQVESEEIDLTLELESDLHCLNLYRLVFEFELSVTVYQLGDEERRSSEPIMISIKLNKITVRMEVDTGAAVSVMSVELYNAVGGGPLDRCEMRLKTYTGEILQPLGVGWLNVEYKSQRITLPITVLNGPVPTLMGRNWLMKLKLDWATLFPPAEMKPNKGSGSKQAIEFKGQKGRAAAVNQLENKKVIKSENVSRAVGRSKNAKIESLVQVLSKENPEVLRKCLKLWEEKQVSKGRINVEDMKKIFPIVFRNELGCLKNVKINIPIPTEAKPKFFKARSVPFALRGRVEDELEKLESQGVWKKVTYSKWAAPIVVVLKDAKDPSGSIRICGDYKITVNSVAPLDNYPIPNTSEQLATLAGGHRFSKIDLSQAYQQVELDEPSKELLTVNTHRGLYRPDRLQFGVHSATGMFQREMERILGNIPHVLVRIDDVLMTAENDWDHFIILINVLMSLENSGLTVNLKECDFFCNEVTFCGYTINKDGVRPMQSNVDAVLNAPQPSNVSEVKSFLGMLNYYQNYLPALSTVAEPIHCLLRKGVAWMWGPEQNKAFSTAKKLLSEAPLLVHYDPSKEIIVHTDASPYGVGSVLSHIYPDNTERPVSYASRSLGVSERNYGHVEKEGLALVFAVKKFHHFVFGQKFTIYTDHKPLLGLFGENKAIPERSAARIARWALMLSAYDYKLLYRQGCLNGNADALSRLPLPATEGEVSQSIMSVHMMELVSSPVTEKEVSNETKLDSVLSLILRYVTEGWKSISKNEENLKPYWIRRDELSVEAGCLLWGTRVIIPQSLRNTVLMELHDVHPGISRMKALSRSFFWWPKMDEDIETLAKSCSTCAVNQANPSAAPVHPWEPPSEPWVRIHMDFAGPLQGKMFLIVIDAYSKWPEVAAMNESTSLATVGKLRRMFATHGLPKVSVSDNGPAFVGDELKQFMKRNGVKQVYSAPYHPASNGQAERMVRVFKESLKTLTTGDIQTKLDRLLYKYRITPHSSTGKTPAQLMFNRELRSPFHLLQPGNQGNQVSSIQNPRQNTRSFEVGAHVWARNFGSGDKWIPGVVKKKLGNVTYEIDFKDKEASNRHINHLKERQGGKQNKLVGQEQVQNKEHLLKDKEHLLLAPSEVSEIEVRGALPIPAINAPGDHSEDTLRRSARVSRRPAWAEDYVTK